MSAINTGQVHIDMKPFFDNTLTFSIEHNVLGLEVADGVDGIGRERDGCKLKKL